VGIAGAPMALALCHQRHQPGAGELQRLAAGGVALAAQAAGQQQLGFDGVTARPAGRTPDLAQPAPMRRAEAGQGRSVRHGR
jgi:pyridoxal biosynthesis lyase PdxS